MKVWLISFVALFGLAELSQWMRAFSLIDDSGLPMPILIGAGLVLAIASNSNKRTGLPWQNPSVDFSSTETQSHLETLPQPPTVTTDQIQLDQTSNSSISFTIHKHSFPQEPGRSSQL